MRIKLLVFSCLVFCASPVFAATYYSDSSLASNCAGGSGTSYRVSERDCAGSDGTRAYTTIQAAVDVATSPGDIVLVRGGTYTSFATKASGSGDADNQRIIVRAYPAETANVTHASATRVRVNTHAYITIEGLTIYGVAESSQGFVVVEGGAHYAKILNNRIYASTDHAGPGINFKTQSGVAPNYGLVEGNEIGPLYYPAVTVLGDHHVVKDNHIHDIWHDVFRSFGTGAIFDGNLVEDIYDDGRTHVDLYQTYIVSGSDRDVRDVVIKNNIFKNANAQPMMIKCSNINLDYTISGIQFINNVFYNVQQQGFIYGDNVSFLHNTFINSASKAGRVIYWRHDSTPAGCHGQDGVVKGNIFIGCGQTAATGGFYGNEVDCPLTADYNYVTQGKAQGFIAKTDFSEANGISGGDPLFVDFDNLDFRLTENSPAVDHITATLGVDYDLLGVSRPQGIGYDVGAYEYNFGDPPLEPTCSPSRRDLCTIDDCATTGEGYWYGGVCNATPESTPGTRKRPTMQGRGIRTLTSGTIIFGTVE